MVAYALTSSGKTEEEVLREAIKQERLRLRLNVHQLEEKAALEVCAICTQGRKGWKKR